MGQTQIIRKGFKFRLNASDDQRQLMLEFSGCNRFVWNKMLAMNLARLEGRQRLLRYCEAAFWLKLWKQSDEYDFLKSTHSQTLQQTLKNLDRAFQDGFDKKQPGKRMPTFKKKGLSDSFRYPQGFKIDQAQNAVFLPKIGWVKYRNSRAVIGEIRNMTVSRRGKHWYISIQTEYEAEIQAHKSTSAIGVDVGIKRFFALSDGKYRKPLSPFKRYQVKLAKLQRQLAKKVKFSNNWRKQKDKIAKLHERIANARQDFLHKASTEISNNHAAIYVESLRIKNMSASAKGTINEPGGQVRQKAGLNRSILDQGWGIFVEQLTYKQQWAGGVLTKVPAHYTSQTCPSCRHVSKDNRKTQSEFACVECGYHNNADTVGAINVLARGLSGDSLWSSDIAAVKQKPAGAAMSLCRSESCLSLTTCQ